MTEFEYLAVVKEQIRQKEIAEEVVWELRTHIQEQAEAYEQEGMEKECAMKRAVEEMGDPVETGVELDRVHQPHMDVKLLIVLLGISAAIYVFQLCGTGEEGWELALRQMNIRSLSLGWMILYGVQKYKAASKHLYLEWAGFLTLSTGFVLLISWILRNKQIQPAWIMIQPILNCSIAFYAKIVYDNRNGGQKHFHRILALGSITCALSLICRSYFYTTLMICAHTLILSMAVKKDWYQISGKKMAKLWALPGIMTGGAVFFLIKGIWEGRQKSGISEYLNILDVPGVLLGNYKETGIIAVVIWVFLMILVGIWMVRDVIKLTNQLCKIYCTGILLAYGISVIFSLLCIMGFGKAEAVFFPFFSIDRSIVGSSQVFYTIFAGLFLQYHRHDRVIPARRTEGKDSYAKKV